MFLSIAIHYAMYSMQEIQSSINECPCVCVSVCPSVTTLASAILNRSSPNFARCFGTRIVRTNSLGIKIGQQIPVLRACAENLQCKEYRGKFEIREKYLQNRVFSQDSLTYRFSGMPDRMAWSDLIPEVVLWPFLRMRSENMAQNPLKVAFDGKQ